MPDAVLRFWFGPGDTDAERLAQSGKWFRKDPAFDQEVRERFGDLLEEAAAGSLDAWRQAPRSALALVLLLDQFPRNIHRDTPQAFVYDPQALDVCLHAREQGHPADLSHVERVFLYMPLMHAEDPLIQDESVRTFTALRAAAPRELRDYLTSVQGFAVRHAEIVHRFGRYPHRNEILGRQSTAEERTFLEGPDSSF